MPRGMVRVLEQEEPHKAVCTSSRCGTCPEGSPEGSGHCCHCMAKADWISTALFYTPAEPRDNYPLSSVYSPDGGGCFCLLSVNAFKKRSDVL